MKTEIRLAQVKVTPVKGNLEANHARLMSVLREVAQLALDVVVTPECFLDGYVCTEEWVTADNLSQYAVEATDSPLVDSVARWAREHASWFVLGCMRRSPQGLHNSAIVFDRDGDLIGTYDKTHCQTHDRKYLPGRRLATFPSDFGPFGIMICADRRWPETVRSLAVRGARIIFNPAYGMHDEKNLWMMRTRSYESEVFIVFTHPKQALVTGPDGRVICNERRDDVTFASCNVDLSQADEARASPSAHLRDRRPDLYTS